MREELYYIYFLRFADLVVFDELHEEGDYPNLVPCHPDILSQVLSYLQDIVLVLYKRDSSLLKRQFSNSKLISSKTFVICC